MGATATLSTQNLAVEPGQQVTCEVAIRNSGGVVDQFSVDVVGEPAAWASVEPAQVNVLPGESATVTVRFAPPRSPEVPAGPAPFGVRVSAREDPGGSVVEEGTIEVAPFTDLAAEVVPNKAQGSTGARYEVAIDNLGNYPVPLTIEAIDREDELRFWLQRSTFDLEPGTTAFIRMRARPRRRFLRGQPIRHPFQVVVSTEAGQQVASDATMVQRQLLPKWLLPVLAALLVLALLLLTLWFTLMRPAVKSAAREAAAQQANEVKQAANDAKTQAGQAKQNSERAMRAVGIDPAAPPGSDPNRPPAGPAPQESIDFRLAASAPITANVASFQATEEYVPPEGKTLVISDLFLQNPRGDVGTLRIVRDVAGEQTVLTEHGLANFRDLDFHWLQPWRIRPGEKLILTVSCQNPPEPGRGACTPSASFSGHLEG
jgi:type II secretory pathway pseudopilin PulG